MTTEGRLLSELEDVIGKVERERTVSWIQWIALARVVYFLLKERHREKYWRRDGRTAEPAVDSRGREEEAGGDRKAL